MRPVFLISLCLAAFLCLGACSVPDIALPTGLPAPGGLLPTDSAPARPPSPTPEPVPTSSAGGVVRGLARPDQIEILMLESFPVQVNVRLTGSLPDGCTRLEPAVVTREANVFALELPTTRPAGQACTQALVPFEQVIPLEAAGLKAGVYQVIANGLQTSFTLAQDNLLLVEPPLKGGAEGGLAVVETVEVLVPGSIPVQVQVSVQGYLPDGCTTLEPAQVTRLENTFSIQLPTRRPKDLLCTQMIVPYQQLVPLDVAGLPNGVYQVVANGVAASFELSNP